MTIEVLRGRGVSQRAIARQLGVHENAVRYRLKRLARQARDRRADQVSSVAAHAEAVAHWMASAGADGLNGRALYEWLVAEHRFAGSYKAVQRFVRARYPKPRLRVRRRVETPPGAQAQADWAEYPGVEVGGERVDLSAFHLVLSHARYEAVVWSVRRDELAWLAVHNAALTRLGGVPAVIRVDNPKTAIGWGAGPWGVVNERYAAYARALRFHVDATRPRAPQEKGKVERRVLAQRVGFDPYREAWRDLAALQARSDESVAASARRRICPATGLSVWESFEAEQKLLTPLPEFLPEPFDRVAQRRVSRDATLSFEGRTYSVPFRFAHQVVEVRGCTATVQMWAEGACVASHPRRTHWRLVIDPRHYEGASTQRVEAPVPLGRMGRRMQEILAMTPERRPIDQYAAYAEGGAMTPESALPKKTPQVDLDRTRERLTRLGLGHAAETLGEHLATAVKETQAPHQFLDRLLEAELVARDERRVRTSVRLSGLPTGQTLASFDFGFQPSVERSRIETLATCAWIRERASLLLQGPPGPATYCSISLRG